MSTSSAAGPDPTAVRLEMLAQGYRPVPVLRFDAKDKAAGKRPTLPEWQTVCEAADETEIRRWARDSGQRNSLNTGLLCGSVVGLDLDVPDEALARQINALADAMLPPTPLIRIGRSPKSLRAFRAEGVHTKASTPALFLPGGIKVQVEALGKGNHFVSFGTHPDTQLPYTWPHQSPLDIRFDDLPVLPDATLRAFLVAAEAGLRAAGGRTEAEIKEAAEGKAKPAASAQKKPRPTRSNDFPPPTYDDVKEALAAVPNRHDWQGWVKIGAAIYDALADDGEDLLIAWSEQSSRNDPDATRRKWKSFSKSKMNISDSTLFWEARQAGWKPQWERERGEAAAKAHTANGASPSFGAPPTLQTTEPEPNAKAGTNGHAPPPEIDDPGYHEAVDAAAEELPHPRRKQRRSPDDSVFVWPIPLDFLADPNGEAPELRHEHIPPAINDFVFDNAARMGVDPTSVALSCIVSCASVASDHWRVQPKRHDYTWTENPRLWGAIVGDPSILKTPVIRAATRPIDMLDTEARARHAEDMRIYKQQLNLAKADKSGATPEPVHPKLNRYLIEGATVEAISEVLRDDSEARQCAPAGKVLSRHDEMSEFFAGLDRYRPGGKGGSDRGAYLRLYNGDRYTVDRIGRGTFAIPNWSACFLGGIQPGPIQNIAKTAAEDGLLQRFLYAVPGPQEAGVDRKPDTKAQNQYNALFPALAALKPSRTPDSKHIEPVVFHADAHQHREAVDAKIRIMTLMPDTSPQLLSAYGKWSGIFARIALTFHLVELAHAAASNMLPPCHYAVITEETARRAAAFMLDIALPHLLRAALVHFPTEGERTPKSQAAMR